MAIFQQILVPVDFTEKNKPALDIAFEMVCQSRARITLLHVIERLEADEDEEMVRFYEKLEKRARQKLQSMARRFVKEDLGVEQEVLFGRRGPEIVRYAIESHTDLVLLSSHKVTARDVAGDWATLSYQISILCPCPVLLVK